MANHLISTSSHDVGTVAGAVTTAVGFLGEGGGAALSATVAGAGVGVPLTLGSAAVVGYGGVVTTTGAIGLLNSGKALLNMSKYKPGQEGGFQKNPQGFNTKVNEQFTSLVKKYKLSKAQQQTLHNQITSRKLTRNEIEEELLELFPDVKK